jgi:hypothetical protein
MRVKAQKAGNKFKVRIAGASGFIFCAEPTSHLSHVNRHCTPRHSTVRITVEVWPSGQAETIVKKSSLQ